MGPQVSMEQLNRIKSYVAIAREEGATVIAAGAQPGIQNGFLPGHQSLHRVKIRWVEGRTF